MITIKLPAGLELPNANKKRHWRVTWRQQQEIKRRTCEVIQLMRLRPMGPIDITVVVHPGPRTRRFDPANWAPAAKPAIDALSVMGVIEDDSSEHVPRVSYVAGDPVPGWRLELVLTPHPEPQTTM